MTNVFHNTDDVAEVGAAWFDRLKAEAVASDRKSARLCLHASADDPLHEMVIVFHKDIVVRPHRHRRKSESYHMIFGELDIVLFDDSGRPSRLVAMGERGSGRTHIYRLSAPIWHSVIVRSEFAAIHEVTNGPFRPEENEYAPWAPDGGAALRSFLADARRALAH